MNITLTYDGNLKANGSPEHKQEVRRIFHGQLKELWKRSPIDPNDPKSKNIMTTIGKFRFLPLVSAGREEVAEIQLIMLRPEQPPGCIIGQGGDIDNRLKTLFDSLKMPEKDEIPNGDQPKDNEKPFFCLLQDDILIANLSVATDRLLEPGRSDSYVKLIIRVQIKKVPIIGASMMTYFVGA